MNRLKYEMNLRGIQHEKLCRDCGVNPVVSSALTSGTAMRVLKKMCEYLKLEGDPIQHLKDGRLVFDEEEKK